MTTFECHLVETPRLTTNVWSSGPQDGRPVLLVHGNLVTGGWWRYVAEALPDDVRVIAPDLRGFGRTQQVGIDATRGLGDMVDDVRGLLAVLGLTGRGDLVAAGWSMGGGVLEQYLLEHPGDLGAVVLVAPLSPYGFGGTKGADGTPCTDDFAGTGGGGAAPTFVQRLRDQDTSDADPTSPRVIFRTFFGPGDNAAAVDEDFLVAEMLRTALGDDFYPGDMTPSEHWPSLAPGDRGVLNAMSPKHFDASALPGLESKPSITWIHGEADQVVSDASMFDFGMLGQLGAVPGWPGADVMPPQPMDSQIRAVLAAYAAAGGTMREIALAGVGHGIPIAAPQVVADALVEALDAPPGD
ncbi:alpha/beta hydrolase [Lapillicoccus sp.]|uniref:alpha/beta fold hydrolase n=1 Tax=Lapillicoccus sp. TaxID=1909287 RepID=UPI0025D177B2|nr:alpha/beta hydrolase [Lapillicoccus sp.]